MSEITLLGYGNQGMAWAKNLKDSGWQPKISGRASIEGGSGMTRARKDGFETIEPENLAENSDPVAFLLPDENIPEFYNRYFSAPNRKPRSFIFAHGFSVVFGQMKFLAKDQVLLMAPKGIGTKLRENYLAGSGVMGVLAVEQDMQANGRELLQKIAEGLGCSRVELIESSFREETMADLLSEQLILCGALPKLLDLCVNFLISKGINPKMAVYECLDEMKLIVDMMVAHGVEGTFRKVSTTAKFGGLKAADSFFPDNLMQKQLEALWKEIDSGKFAADFYAEKRENFPSLKEKLLRYRKHPADQFIPE